MTTIALSEFDRFRKEPSTARVTNFSILYAPVDDIPGALRFALSEVRFSLSLAMFGFDDQILADQIEVYCRNPGIKVQLNFDASQAMGPHEKFILGREKYPNTSVAVGNSEKGAIMHLKAAVIDSTLSIHGSTNWSTSGQTLQDNELILSNDIGIVTDLTNRISAIHANMLAQPQPTTKIELARMVAAAPQEESA